MRAVVALLFSLSIVGCGRIERTSECRSFAKTVNAELDELAPLVDAGTDGGKNDADLAKRYAALAEKIRGFKFSEPAADKTKTEYADLMQDTSKALEARAHAEKAGDRTAVPRTRTTFAQIQRREKMLVARLDSQCESP